MISNPLLTLIEKESLRQIRPDCNSKLLSGKFCAALNKKRGKKKDGSMSGMGAEVITVYLYTRMTSMYAGRALGLTGDQSRVLSAYCPHSSGCGFSSA